MDTVRQRIVDAIESRFKGITTAAGFRTNIGKKVWVCRPINPTDDECVGGALNIWDLREDIQAINTRVHEMTLNVTAMILYTGTEPGKWVRNVMADLVKAIWRDRRWDELATDTKLKTNEYEISQEKLLTGAVKFEFTVTYRCPLGDFEHVA